MHDPSTVAHEIKWPVRVTIWHEDPLNFKDRHGCRDDDSCGWFSPPYSQAERDLIKKLAKEQYSEIFAKQVRTAEGASYAYICNEPDCHSAIYWSWRAIKHKFKPRGPWQYGVRLTAAELEAIYDLATCPIDNLQSRFNEVRDLDSFDSFFFLVWRAYQRHHRPWYKHPRWHVQHWRFQVHLWQTFRRWALTRCEGCGKRFSWGYCPTSHSWDSQPPRWFRGERGLYHSECSGMTMALHRAPPKGNA